MDDKGIKRIALVTNNGSFGKGEHDAFTKALDQPGVKPVADQVVTATRRTSAPRSPRSGRTRS